MNSMEESVMDIAIFFHFLTLFKVLVSMVLLNVIRMRTVEGKRDFRLVN